MIKAIVEGRKTQTRRRIDIDPLGWELSGFNEGGLLDFGVVHFWRKDYNSQGYTVKPRYQVGEVVYIKEAWCESYYGKPTKYKLDGEGSPGPKGFWRSPLFLAAENARYFIKITDVRAERLQEITLSDIYDEGCPLEVATIFTDPMAGYETKANAYEWYHDIWDSINKKTPWASNPWIWVYTFRVAPNKEEWNGL